MANLIIETPKLGTQTVELTGLHSVGRHPSQDIQVMDRLVSKQHCLVRRATQGWEVEDAGSRNGTFINNKRVEAATLLKHGDRIMVGATRITFEDEPEVEEEVLDITESAAASVIQSVVDPSEALEFLPANMIEDTDLLRRDYEKLRFAYQLHREIALELDLNNLLQTSLEMIMSFLPAVDRALVLLRKKADEGLYVARRLYRKGIDESQKMTVSSTIVNRVVRDKKAVLSNDAIVDDRFDGAHSIMLQGIRSAMGVPMMGRDQEVLGVLVVDSLKKIGAFTERDLNTVQGFAAQAASSIENTYMARRIEEEAATRGKLQRFLSPNLVNRVLAGELELEKGGAPKDVAVLFSDIRKFTALSERHTPGDIIDLLNAYFERMAEIVFDYDGTLDKFIGDALMALWGAPLSGESDALNAARAAIRMQQAMREFNVEAEAIIGEGIGVGIGIDIGPVVAGLMGSSQTMNYTVIGAHVNRSARLCSAAKPGEIIISKTMWEQVRDEIPCEPLEPMVLKGIAQPVPVFRITGIT
jgi:adenylate cyclase